MKDPVRGDGVIDHLWIYVENEDPESEYNVALLSP